MRDNGFGRLVIDDAQGREIARTDNFTADDAMLIAAAPDLLAALKHAVGVIQQWHGDEVFDIYRDNAPEMKPIRDAIARAEGRQP